MNRVFFILVCLLGLVIVGTSCKTVPVPTLRITEKDSCVTKTETKTDSIAETILGEDFYLQTFLYCDSMNNVHMKAIDSMSLRLLLNAEIIHDTLFIRAKVKDYTYYKKYIYEKTMSEYYKNKTIEKVVPVTKNEPINRILVICVMILMAVDIGYLLLKYLSKKWSQRERGI